MKYEDFLSQKGVEQPDTGLADIPELPSCLFPFQRDIVRWALRRGRAAIFAGTGLGKSLMELAWADAIHRATGRDILHLAPLAVSAQMAREADKFSLTGKHVRQQADCIAGDNITNYQKLEHFDLSRFGGVILDESSILKSFDGKTRTMLIEKCKAIPFRLAATATPSPNDFMELGNHAEFLDIMSYTDMLATFFVHDGGDTAKWRLKGHAEGPFWRWMCSWAVMLQRPSDFGYEDAGYNLPPLVQNEHIVSVEYQPSMETGLLFPMEARSLSERIGARRDTTDIRVEKAISIVTADYWFKLTECHGNQNTKLTDAQKLSVIQTTLINSKASAAERPKKTGNTCGPIIGPTKISGSCLPKSERNAMPPVALNTYPDSGNGARAKAGMNINIGAETAPCGPTLELASQNMTPYWLDRADAAPSAAPDTPILGDTVYTSTTATKPGASEDFCVDDATSVSANLPTAETGSQEPLNISTNLTLDRWVIWCQLNKEQDALKAAFGDLCYSVSGSDSEEEKEASILAWLDGGRPILLSKPSICGFGMNFQACNRTIFVGLNDSFEQVYQAIRRFWRFGQTKPVNVHFIAAETEGAVLANIRRKEADAERMGRAMVAHMASLNIEHIKGATRDRADYMPTIPVTVPAWLEGEHA